ncbi:hypothetical protein BFL35_16520 (plasmid) [Clavibacter michiganensis]|nr:hypothetical protein BFL35_16520 [Clavibacter michiganensis]
MLQNMVISYHRNILRTPDVIVIAVDARIRQSAQPGRTDAPPSQSPKTHASTNTSAGTPPHARTRLPPLMSRLVLTLGDERGRALPLNRIDGREHPVSKVKSKLDGIDSLVRDVCSHPWAPLEAGYWRIQVEEHPVLGYVMRHRAELGDPFTFEVYADARNDLGQRIWLRREESLKSAAAWMIQNSDRLIAFAARHAAAAAAELEVV